MFKAADFLHDLTNISWNDVLIQSDPNEALATWYHLFTSVLDKHAPMTKKRVSNQHSLILKFWKLLRKDSIIKPTKCLKSTKSKGI